MKYVNPAKLRLVYKAKDLPDDIKRSAKSGQLNFPGKLGKAVRDLLKIQRRNAAAG